MRQHCPPASNTSHNAHGECSSLCSSSSGQEQGLTLPHNHWHDAVPLEGQELPPLLSTARLP